MGNLNINFHAKKENLIIFIHGLFGSEKTWKNKKEDRSLLELLYKGIIKDNFDIGEFKYKTNKVKKFYLLKKDQLGIEENSKLLKSEIDIKGKDYKNIILIGHSMGGLIAKQYLLNNLELNKIVKYISIATPHKGSNLAKYAKCYHNQIEELVQNNSYLSKINDEWISSQEKLPITYYFYAAYDKIVGKNSAVPFDEASNIFSFAEDHSSIVKVNNENSVCIKLKYILEDFIKENNPKKILMVNLSKKNLNIECDAVNNLKESHYTFNSISDIEKNKIFEVLNGEVQRLKDSSLFSNFIKEYTERIKKMTSRTEEIVYTGIPLIPLIFLDGYNTKMINKRRYIINYRGDGLREALNGNIENDKLYMENNENIENGVTEINIAFSYSFIVEESSVKLARPDIPIIKIKIEATRVDGVTHYSQVEYLAIEFIKYIRIFKEKGIKRVNLFCAIPVPLIFEIGRKLESHDLSIVVYNYNSMQTYEWGIDIKESKLIIL